MKRNSQKLLVGMLGWAVLLLGLVMIPYPGPGWAVVFIGLSILAREFVWARRVNDAARDKYDSWQSWILQQSLFVKVILGLLTTMTVVITIWLFNGYGLLNQWFSLGQDWVQSPLIK